MKSMKSNLMFWIITYEKLAMAMLVGVAAYFLMISMTSDFSTGEVRVFMGFIALYLSVMILTN